MGQSGGSGGCCRYSLCRQTESPAGSSHYGIGIPINLGEMPNSGGYQKRARSRQAPVMVTRLFLLGALLLLDAAAALAFPLVWHPALLQPSLCANASTHRRRGFGVSGR